MYRGRLKTGEEVAVKVQRPGVLVSGWGIAVGVGCRLSRSLSEPQFTNLLTADSHTLSLQLSVPVTQLML